MNKIFFNKRGEGHIKTAVIIIIAVVLGGLLIAGAYMLFGGDNGVLTKASTEVNALMDYGENASLRYVSVQDGNRTVLRYSYDGTHWFDCHMPSYSETTTVYGTMTDNAEENPVSVALLKDGSTYYILSSEDGGISWTQKYNFNAQSITHCYYGTSAQLPNTAGSFSGERFVIRYWAGGQTYYTMTTPTGLEWKAGWSDMILI